MSEPTKHFALTGAAGFIAPKHMQAIKDSGGTLAAAIDPHDSVGILDRYFPNAKFFTEVERFDRFLEKRRRSDHEPSIDYVSICSPNYLHDSHVRLALRVNAHAICEKPLVINPWNLEQLEEFEQDHNRRVYTVLQLRQHPTIKRLKQEIEQEANPTRRDICLTYITRRGSWYHTSWKGDSAKSGGLSMNIGIHFFDFLLWLYGSAQRNLLHVSTENKMSGCLELEHARVRWFLSVDESELPAKVRAEGGYAYRSITIDGEELDLSTGFTELHTEVYREILAGGGYGIADARPAIELVYHIRNTVPSMASGFGHPLISRDKPSLPVAS